MRQVTVKIESIAPYPYSQSAKHDAPFLERESHDDYEARTWRLKCTVNSDGVVCIPAMAFKQAVDTVAFKLGEKVPNRRGATFKSFFASGFFCDQDVPIANGKPLTPKDAVECAINAHSTGKRGSGSRVLRRFPNFEKWHGEVKFTILDDVITPEIFERHVKAAGMIVGIGRFRPENGGTNGRFRATEFKWKEFKI